jgi:hypothetical protein
MNPSETRALAAIDSAFADKRVHRVPRNLQAGYWFMATLVAIAGCTSGNGSPTPGKVSLELVGISDADMVVALENGLDREIYVPGGRTLLLAISVLPGETKIECDSAPGRRDQWDSGSMTAAHRASAKCRQMSE